MGEEILSETPRSLRAFPVQLKFFSKKIERKTDEIAITGARIPQIPAILIRPFIKNI